MKARAQNAGKQHRNNVDRNFHRVESKVSIKDYACWNKIKNAKHLQNQNITNDRVHPINYSN